MHSQNQSSNQGSVKKRETPGDISRRGDLIQGIRNLHNIWKSRKNEDQAKTSAGFQEIQRSKDVRNCGNFRNSQEAATVPSQPPAAPKALVYPEALTTSCLPTVPPSVHSRYPGMLAFPITSPPKCQTNPSHWQNVNQN